MLEFIRETNMSQDIHELLDRAIFTCNEKIALQETVEPPSGLGDLKRCVRIFEQVRKDVRKIEVKPGTKASKHNQ